MGMNLNHVIIGLYPFPEKIMYTRFKSFYNKHDIFYHKQYGFRDHRSTEHAVLDTVKTIQENMEKGDVLMRCFYRFKKSVRHCPSLYLPAETLSLWSSWHN